jgi:hypothetical protein
MHVEVRPAKSRYDTPPAIRLAGLWKKDIKNEQLNKGGTTMFFICVIVWLVCGTLRELTGNNGF